MMVTYIVLTQSVIINIIVLNSRSSLEEKCSAHQHLSLLLL